MNFILYLIVGPGLFVFGSEEMGIPLLLYLEGLGQSDSVQGSHYLMVYVPTRKLGVS